MDNQEKDINRILHNKLKSVSVDRLENGISKVLSELIGEDYKCSIGNIKYSLFSGAEINLKVELSLDEDEAGI